MILKLTYKAVSEIASVDRKNKKLSEILALEEIEELENKIINYFKSIPRNYSLYLRLGRDTYQPPSVVKVSDKISLLLVTKDHQLLSLKASKNYSSEKPVFREGNVVLRVQMSGYAKDSFDNDSALSDAYNSYSFGKRLISWISTLFN